MVADSLVLSTYLHIYNLLYRLNAQHTPLLRTSFQDVEHDSEHPVLFNTVRSGENRSTTFGWFWQYNRRFMLTAEAPYIDNSSHIELLALLNKER